jgi:hypothetical protein
VTYNSWFEQAQSGSHTLLAITTTISSTMQAQLAKSLLSAITPRVASTLETHGASVVDELFSPRLADALRQEIVTLFQVRQGAWQRVL